MIGRRCFIALMGAIMVARPLSTRAQQPGTPVIGFLNNLSPGAIVHPLAAFREGQSSWTLASLTRRSFETLNCLL